VTLAVRAFLAVVILAWSGSPARASDPIFDYAVERFEGDGNLLGSADGVFHLVDEFDDGILGPTFTHLFGTTVEENGALHLKSPGTPFSLNLPWTLDQSDVESASVLMREGYGAGVYRTTWAPTAVGVNHYLHMTFWAGAEVIGLALTNFDDTIGDLYDPPFPTGLQMTAHHERLQGLSLTTVSLEHHAVAALPGAIVFELRYDDTTRSVSVGFSVDGGTTFDRTFAPIPTGFAPGSQNGALILVGADPYVPNAQPPPPDCPMSFMLGDVTVKSGSSTPGKDALKLHGTIGNDVLDPAHQGMTLTLLDTGASSGQAAWVVAIPSGGPGTGCGPRDGWKLGSRGTAVYRNVSGAFPPACAPGSASGLVTARVRQGALDVQVAVKRATVPAVAGPVVVTYGNPAAPSGQCGIWTSAAAPCVPRGSKLRCR